MSDQGSAPPTGWNVENLIRSLGAEHAYTAFRAAMAQDDVNRLQSELNASREIYASQISGLQMHLDELIAAIEEDRGDAYVVGSKGVVAYPMTKTKIWLENYKGITDGVCMPEEESNE